MKTCILLSAFAILIASASTFAADPAPEAVILTPTAPATPRINGPTVFGVRPLSPFLYSIPATGDRPMEFAVDQLPRGLSIDKATGHITGVLAEAGEHAVVLRATNSKGAAEKKFRIVVGDHIALTPAMGWNSWNCWAGSVDQEKVMKSARAIVSSGLIEHGWTYVNIDDTWQGQRGGPDHALQGNEKFPDMHKLCDDIHGLGLKAGIYSTPWITSYAKYPGGSSDQPDGVWTKELTKQNSWRNGKFGFAPADARQWAQWGFDYLKYDWKPNDIEHVREMSVALRTVKRDIVYSLSNTAPFDEAAELAQLANSWRTTGDIFDEWTSKKEVWQFGVSEIGFSQERWAPHAAPGHWNDPDMLVVGHVGWGPQLHASHLTPDEQYSHISLWCMLSAPLLIGCDLDRLDPFTLNLLTNDEVLAIDQDALGRQAVRVLTTGAVDVYLKDLEDGSFAVGFFNRDSVEQKFSFNKLGYIVGPDKRVQVRDVWRQVNLPEIANTEKTPLQLTIPSHGVVLLKLTQVK